MSVILSDLLLFSCLAAFYTGISESAWLNERQVVSRLGWKSPFRVPSAEPRLSGPAGPGFYFSPGQSSKP